MLLDFKDIPSFCFPDLETLRLEYPLPLERGGASMENFVFTLTDQQGGRVYGVCLRFLPQGEGQRFGVQVTGDGDATVMLWWWS